MCNCSVIENVFVLMMLTSMLVFRPAKLTDTVPYTEHGKSKAVLVDGWTGPEGSRRSRLPDLKTIST